MDWDVLEQKLEALRRCLRRIEEKCPIDAETLAHDYDAQDILSLNLSRAVQLCVDIGAHWIAGTEVPPPTTMGETFDSLVNAGVLPAALGSRMKKAVGFRNLAIHQYEAINWHIVYAIAPYHVTDFESFAKAIISSLEERQS